MKPLPFNPQLPQHDTRDRFQMSNGVSMASFRLLATSARRRTAAVLHGWARRLSGGARLAREPTLSARPSEAITPQRGASSLMSAPPSQMTPSLVHLYPRWRELEPRYAQALAEHLQQCAGGQRKLVAGDFRLVADWLLRRSLRAGTVPDWPVAVRLAVVSRAWRGSLD